MKIKVVCTMLGITLCVSISCTKMDLGTTNKKEEESKKIYMQVLQRADQFNNAKVVVNTELI